jgi:phosphocarrier protein HPr
MSGTQRPSAARRFQIKNRLGLHARAAAQLVQALAGLDADIVVSKDGQGVNGKSILGLMMLAAAQGTEIEVLAEGPDANVALETVAQLIDNRFYEES